MNKKILIIENDRTYSTNLADILERLSVECDFAEDYETADRLIRENMRSPYMLYMVDIELGANLGFDLIERHKAVLTRENTAIVTTWGKNYEARLRDLHYPTLNKADPALRTSNAQQKIDAILDFVCSLPSVKKAGVSFPPSSL